MKFPIVSTFVLTGFLAATSALYAADPSGLNAQDKLFAPKATGDGLAEVKLGQLAAKKGKCEPVKQFGQQMVQDHSKAGEELKSLATPKHIKLPTAPPAEKQAVYNQLSKLNGEAFDKAYVAEMVKAHNAAISDFRKESKDGKDVQLTGFARKTLPTLQHHLAMAKKMETQHNGGAAPAQKKYLFF